MRMHSFFAALFVLVGTVAAGCSSSTSGGSTPGFYCSQSIAGTSICYGYTNLTSDQQNSVKNACSQASGTNVSSCPTADLVGCCKYTTGGITTEACYYGASSTGGSDAGTTTGGDAGGGTGGTSSIYQQACSSQSGTWSTSQ